MAVCWGNMRERYVEREVLFCRDREATVVTSVLYMFGYVCLSCIFSLCMLLLCVLLFVMLVFVMHVSNVIWFVLPPCTCCVGN